MKMLPIPLSLSGPQLGLWSDVLWRYPQAPPSPLAELKTQLPPQLHPDPRLWGREDVTVFLRFCEREFDLPKFELDLFQMNGKALCLLTRTDFGERCPGAGDVLHNVLQMLIRESQMMQRHLPSSPVTPTSRYPLSPHSHPPTPNWATLAPPESPFHNAHLHHFMQPNSVTLSPAPSIDSQASSPPQNQSDGGSSGGSVTSSSSNHNNNQNVFTMNHQNNTNNTNTNNNANSSSSNQSDSDEDSYTDAKPQLQNISPPTTPILKDLKPSLSQQITNVVNSWSSNHNHHNGNNNGSSNNLSSLKNCDSSVGGGGGPGGGGGSGGSVSAPSTPGAYMPVKREFFPETPEPNTNGRLLWDFLQQLLNDPAQRYSNYIAWKCRDTGVFKIVDPAGLARLWGIQKNHLSMNYDKMSRALRYYYRVNILRKVQGERHCYQFLRNPTELKNIKNISLLRQSIANSTSSSSSSVSSNASSNTSNSSSSSTNNAVAAAAAAAAAVQQQNTQQSHSHHHLQQQQQQQQLSLSTSQQQNSQLCPPQALPQLTSQTMSPPTISSSSPSPYGPPPTSPLIMHAINGAFHYLSTSAAAAAGAVQPPPHSPVLPTTPCEKLQFNNLKIEGNNAQEDDMKPTDLSVGGDRRYNNNNSGNSSSNSTNGDCYPLIRNSDGLTTIKLIRSYENASPHQQQQQQIKLEHPSISTAHRQPSPQPPTSSSQHTSNGGGNGSSHHHHQSQVDAMQCSSSSSPRPDNDDVNVDDCLMPTDLRK